MTITSRTLLPLLPLLLLTVTVLAKTTTSTTTTTTTVAPLTSLLFRVSQGGNGQFTAGIFASVLDDDPTASRYVHDPYRLRVDFNDSSSSDSLGSGYAPSRRPLTADTVFEDRRGDRMYASLRDDAFTGVPDIYEVEKPRCIDPHGSTADTLHFRPLYTNLAFRSGSAANDDVIPAECRWRCGWGPFSVDRGRLYSVVSGVFGTGGAGAGGLHHEIQLRHVRREECGDKLAAGNGQADENEVDIVECSELIAVVKSTPADDRKASHWAGSSLVVVPGEAQRKHFIFQVYGSEGSQHHVTLVRISETTGDVETLHRVRVPRSVANMKYKIKAIGSVDYRDGTLCWTVVSALYCVDYEHTFPPHFTLDKNSTRIVSRITEQQVALICKGAIRKNLRKLLTGVAIYKTSRQLRVYFGCYSEISGNGGAGVLSMSVLKQNLVPLTSAGVSSLFAGSVMVLEQAGPQECTTTTTTTTTTSTTSSTTTAASVEHPSSNTVTRSTTPTTTPATTTRTPATDTPTTREPRRKYTIVIRPPPQKEVQSSGAPLSPSSSLLLLLLLLMTLLNVAAIPITL